MGIKSYNCNIVINMVNLVHITCITLALLTVYISASPFKLKGFPLKKRSEHKTTGNEEIHIVEECLHMTSEDGVYLVQSTGEEDTCGIYVVSEPDYNVDVDIYKMNVDCISGGLISVIDGWELSGEVFPSISDHELPMDSRFKEVCGTKEHHHILTAHQNAALIMYRLPKNGDFFAVTITFKKNNEPCNILTEGTSAHYTLRNHGKHRNCSLMAMYPASLDVTSLEVGNTRDGITHMSNEDEVEIGGSNGLDIGKLQVADVLSGAEDNPRQLKYGIGCGVTGVRLVSSGRKDNSVSIAINQLDLTAITSLDQLNLTCH